MKDGIIIAFEPDPLMFKILEANLVKIDVEGMALRVLMGGVETLSSSRPKMVIELHPGEETVEPFLERLGFKVLKPSKYFVIAE